MVPLLGRLTESQHQLVIYLLALIARASNGAVPTLSDQDVADAASAHAATIETAGRGIIYQHQPTSISAQRLAADIARGIAEVAAQAGSQRGRIERDAAIALRQIAEGASTAAKALEGDEPPVFLRLVERIMRAATSGNTDDKAAADRPGPDAGTRLIIP